MPPPAKIETLAASYEQAPIATELVGVGGDFLAVNAALCELTGYERARLIGTASAEISHPDQALREAGLREALLAGQVPRYKIEKRLVHASGQRLEVGAHVSLVRDGDGAPLCFLGQMLDITEHKRLERDLQHLADHDPLTGLLSRRRFEAELDRHVDHIARYGSEGAVLVLDIDHFKQVNDALGHGRGDELIIDVARILQAQLRRSDRTARLGGDEFAILLPEANREQAGNVAAKLVEAVRREAVVLPGRSGRRVTVSVGVMAFEGCEGLTGADAIVDADLAMYDAKERGRDTFAFFEPDAGHGPRIRARASWFERIEAAIEEDRFALQAQPIVELGSGAVVQHELLIRMLDERGELIPPATFLSVAERYGQIARIDAWVARRAVELLAELEAAGAARTLAINLSAHALGDRELLAGLERQVSESGVDASNLVVEISEGAAIADIGRARALAARLKALGCRVALDDFGAGVGSIYHLKHLPLDYIKIDGELVEDCARDERDRLAISAVVAVAKGLGVATVAESVAEEDVAAALREIGVDLAQGSCFGMPRDLAQELMPATGDREQVP
jgi:diguanylate cyclase (GGDEF)-like protein/PAS domain S-box-containing protein